MAGFQPTLYGRFWVTPEAGGTRFSRNEDRAARSAARVCTQGEPHTRTRILLHAGIKIESRAGAAAAREIRLSPIRDSVGVTKWKMSSP